MIASANASENPSAIVSPQLLRALDLAITLAVCFAVALRPFSAGQPASEAETGFITAILWFAFFVWGMRKIVGGSLSLPKSRIWLPLLAFVGAIGLSMHRAYTAGTFQISVDLAYAWSGDFIMLLLAADHFRRPGRFRLLMCCLLAGMVAVGAYGIYQRFYGLDYFRHVMEQKPEMIDKSAGHSELQIRDFHRRIQSNRIHGPLGYPNALGGFFLMFLPALFPFCFSWRKFGEDKRDYLLIVAGVIAVTCLMLSGSKAGFIAAKVTECIALWLALPRGRRRFSSAMDIVSAVAIYSICGLFLTGMVLVAVSKTLGFNTAIVVAQIMYAAFWSWELFRLCGRCAGSSDRESFPLFGSRIRIVGVVLTLAVLGGAFSFLAYGPSTKPDANGHRDTLAHIRHDALKTFRVRYKYWCGAENMIKAHPLRGVGLDNFGQCYSKYRVAGGWPVKRVHNNYLQMAADGGLPLLAAFLLFWLVLLFLGNSGAVNRSSEADDEFPQYKGKKLAIGFSAAVFGLTYLLYTRGMFYGLSIEFMFLELWGSAQSGSILAASGNPIPLIIHGATHLVVLPVVWALAFMVFWNRFSPSGQAEAGKWLKLGVAGILIHTFADFHYHVATISLLLFALAGLSIAAGFPADRRLRLPSKLAFAMLLIWLIPGWIFLKNFPLQHLKGCFQLRISENAWDAFRRQSAKKRDENTYKDLLNIYKEALELRPMDSEIYRKKGNILLTQLNEMVERRVPASLYGYERVEARQRVMRYPTMQISEMKEEIMHCWEEQIRLNPCFADGYSKMADYLLMLYPGDKDKRKQAEEYRLKAIENSPLRPIYHLNLAEVYIAENRMKDAGSAAKKALELHQLFLDDEQTRLNEKRLKQAEKISILAAK